MDIDAINFDADSHYKIICSWWDAHKWPSIPMESLPQTGIIITIDGEPICAVWLYKSDSNLCWMEWMISNPKSPKAHREIALPLLIDTCTNVAKQMGFKIIFTSIKHTRLLKRLTGAGFNVDDTNATNLTKVL